MEPGSGATVPVVATKTRVVVRAFRAVLPDRTVAKAEDAVNQGESSL